MITDHIRQLADALAQVLEETTALGRLRVAALRLHMPLVEVTGDELVAMAAAGTDWDEAARRIMAVPGRPEATSPSLLD